MTAGDDACSNRTLQTAKTLNLAPSCQALFAIAVALAMVFAGTAHGQRGALTAPRDLAQMTQQASAIVRGRVTSAMVEPDPQFTHLQTVVVRLSVQQVLKGAPVKTYTFRQFIWDARDERDAAGYHPGEEMLLFMNAPNENGLSSPVGLDQGRFRIVRTAKGNLAVNGQNNAGLLAHVAGALQQRQARVSARAARVVASPRHGPVAVEVLEELTRGLTGKP